MKVYPDCHGSRQLPEDFEELEMRQVMRVHRCRHCHESNYTTVITDLEVGPKDQHKVSQLEWLVDPLFQGVHC